MVEYANIKEAYNISAHILLFATIGFFNVASLSKPLFTILSILSFRPWRGHPSRLMLRHVARISLVVGPIHKFKASM